MNPLNPSPRLLRRIAAMLQPTADRAAAKWVRSIHEMPRTRRMARFHRTSVVETFRNGRLCGLEVWRHLESSRHDPKRRKARLWFGNRKHGRKKARQLAYNAAAMMSRMSDHELREWWSEYRAARAANAPMTNLWRDEQRFEDGLDYTDRCQISRAFCAIDSC